MLESRLVRQTGRTAERNKWLQFQDLVRTECSKECESLF